MSPGCTIRLSEDFQPYFSMLIMSLPLLGLGPQSTSRSSGFCVCRPRQHDTICWELKLVSGFFAFSENLFGQIETMNVASVL